MSWRRFLVLCQNLSPYGAVAVRMREMDDAKDAAQSENPDDDRRAADAFFTSIVTRSL